MAGVHVVGLERISQSLRQFREAASEAAREGTKKTLEQIARQERTLLSLGWHAPGTPTGSVPPSPPWRISGDLSRSVEVIGPVRYGGVFPRWAGKVGAAAVYARIQELGGWAGRNYSSYLPPRPHLEPAVRIVIPRMKFIYDHELRRRIKFKVG